MKRYLNLLTVALLLICSSFSLVACSSSQPSDEEIVTQISATMKDSPLYHYSDVKKVNGQVLGEGQYMAECTWNVQTKMDFKEVLAQLQREAGNDPFSEKAMEASFAIDEMKARFGVFKKDQVFPQKDQFLFAKTEKGWKIQSL